MSARLPLPVRRVLRAPIADAAMERMIAKAAGQRPRWRLPRAWVAVAGVAAAAALVAWLVWPREVVLGPLRDASGALLADAYDARRATSLALGDGSTIALETGSSLATLENDAHDVSFLLERGRVTFDVRPHGARRWTIECGLATVVVVGTRFTIVREAHRLVVSVERGSVLVRGDLVPDHARRLGAGESLEVSEPLETVTPSAPSAVAEVSAVEPVEPRESARVRGPSWRALAAETRWDDAFHALGPGGVSAATDGASVEDLLVLADVARLSGHLADAVSPLERVMDEHPEDPNASLAAFSLGRIEDQLAQPARAADAFGRALALGRLPAALRADALARRASALERAGDHQAAVESAAAYLRDHPGGSDEVAMRAIEARR